VSDKILVFIPCYNCEPQIPRVLAQFTPDMAKHFHEVLVLDNNSRDNTAAVASQAALKVPGLKVTVARNVANYNLGGSHKSAFAYARAHGFTHVVVLHGDDQGSIADLIPVLTSGRHREMDACLGARFMRGSRLKGYSRFRIFGNLVFNLLFTLGTLRSVHDLGSGLNIFGRTVFEDPKVHRYADDLRFNVYLLLGMFSARMRTEFFPISWREDDQVSNVKMASQAMRTLKLLWQSTLSGQRFWGADHRDQPFDNYTFDVLSENGH